MRNLLFFVAVYTLNLSANACLSLAEYPINDDTKITSQGIYSKSNKVTNTCKDFQVGAKEIVSDNNGIDTHNITMLKCKSDQYDIISSLYLIEDIRTGAKDLVEINSGYLGGGSYNKELRLTPNSGCGGVTVINKDKGGRGDVQRSATEDESSVSYHEIGFAQ